MKVDIDKYNKLFYEVTDETIKWIKTRIEYYTLRDKAKREIFQIVCERMIEVRNNHDDSGEKG